MKNFFFLCICFLLFNCCKKDKQPDPCEGIRISEPVGFKIEEFMYDNDGGREDIVFESADTVLEGNLIRFTSNRTYDSYAWKIGTEAELRTGNPIGILFSSNHLGKISITLIGKRKPRPECIPNDDGIDSFSRLITVVLKDSSRMYGKYQGYNTDNPNDTFTIQIKNIPLEPYSFYRGKPGLYNLPQGCLIIDFDESGSSYKAPVYFNISLANNGFYSRDQKSGDDPLCGIVQHSSGKLSQNNQNITINYSSFHDGEDGKTLRIPKIFIGTRVN